jgi:hypothetical protein
MPPNIEPHLPLFLAQRTVPNPSSLYWTTRFATLMLASDGKQLRNISDDHANGTQNDAKTRKTCEGLGPFRRDFKKRDRKEIEKGNAFACETLLLFVYPARTMARHSRLHSVGDDRPIYIQVTRLS